MNQDIIDRPYDVLISRKAKRDYYEISERVLFLRHAI